ncbi:hypothetical protein [Acidocella sp. MX-AZ02]|uniref:hypothetical protein n=1 Tax=Acidocella sp. MX-AZ02 TaxID=1214225 RepID=UPI001969C2FE|nr:hypothetical protein [Acidocella sp. MX-AZ02]
MIQKDYPRHRTPGSNPMQAVVLFLSLRIWLTNQQANRLGLPHAKDAGREIATWSEDWVR